MRRAAFIVWLVLGASAAPAAADPGHVLRMATVAPEGTAWARELKAFARDVTTQTNGALEIKWYLGGIAGDDVQVADRIRRGQLDGVGSGGMLCDRLSPTMRAAHLITVTREEASYVLRRAKLNIEEEFLQAGFVHFGGAGIGPTVFYTREPLRSMADLKRMKHWVWDLDEAIGALTTHVGLKTVLLPLDQAGRAYDDGRIDGFVAVPTAALAFQWASQARYVSDLQFGFMTGCVLIANRAMDALPIELRDFMRAAGAKLALRMEDMGRMQDQVLLGGLTARQGLTLTPAPPGFRAEFQAAMDKAREQLGEKFPVRAPLERTLKLLAEYRKEHARGSDKR
jgi:TRAP-type transport system periplasmic protein